MDANVLAKTNDGLPLGLSTRIIVLVFVGLILLLGSVERANLVDPIPLALTVGSAAIGLGGGAWLSFKIRPPSYMGTLRRTLAHVAIPIFAAFMATFLARVGVEAAAFAGLRPTGRPIEAQVTSKYRQRIGPTVAEVSFGPGTRTVDIPVSAELYGRLEPWRQPGRDCLDLTVELGRWGLRRAMLPRRFLDDPIGVDHYEQCKAIASVPN